MPEFKGTPGPWSVINTADVFSALGAPSGDGVNADANDGWLIADCENGFANVDGIHTELGLDVQRANAQLIAAAPDLLDALQSLKCELILSDVDMGYIESHFRPSLNKAAAAIAKALGQ